MQGMMKPECHVKIMDQGKALLCNNQRGLWPGGCLARVEERMGAVEWADLILELLTV